MTRAYIVTFTHKNGTITLGEHMFSTASQALRFAKSRIESGLFTSYKIHTIYL